MLKKATFAGLTLLSAPALAQETRNNAVTQADDAFGRAVGTERIGIYSNDEVRGFNPVEAGNQRLDGLFIEQGMINPPRLIESSSVRVGYAARGTPFPAPTGIVELKMEKYAGKAHVNAELEWESNHNVGGAIEAKIPLAGERFGLAVGLGLREADQVQGRNGNFLNWMAGATFLPQAGSEFTVFTSGARALGAEFGASFYSAGGAVPPPQPRKLQQSQPWADSRFTVMTSGGIAKFPLGDFRVEAGLFRATRADYENYFTLLLGVDATGAVANHVVIADGDNHTNSTSGEVRISRSFTRGELRHTVIAAVRGRRQHRDFGGQQRISFGPSLAGIQDVRPEPAIVLGANDQSSVSQTVFGLQYNLQSRGGALLSLAVQKAVYRKATDFFNPALTDTTSRDTPWLFSLGGALPVADGLSIYGGYVRGMEESAIAPDIAVNRNEAPPALRTRQMDAGLRYALTPKLALIAGVFAIKKPYFGLDAGLRYGELGTVSNRGAELSLAGSLASGLTVVAGGILVDPKISGAEVIAGRVGQRPVGSFKRKGIFNLDYRPGGTSAWSVDLAFEAISGEAADRLNTFSTQGRTNLNLGARYRFAVGSSQMLLRAQLQNAFDSYGWRVNPSGAFTFTPPRTAYLQLVADF